jgi:hypothetical protein
MLAVVPALYAHNTVSFHMLNNIVFNKRQLGVLALFMLLVFPSIGDWVNGFFSIKYGINIISNAYRMAIILFSLFLLFHYRANSVFLLLFLLLTFIVLIHMNFMAFFTEPSILDDAKYWLSASFYLFCLIIFHYLLCNNYINIEQIIKALIRYGEIAAIILFTSLIFNIGVPTFYSTTGEVFGFGTQSYYIAGNSLGLVLVVGLALASIRFFKDPSYFKLISIFTIYIGAFCIGSRTGMIISSLIVTISIFIFLFLRKGSYKYKMVIYFFIVPVFVFVGLKSYEIFTKYSHMLAKVEAVLSGNPRGSLADAGSAYINDQSFDTLLIGRGFKNYRKKFAIYSPKISNSPTSEQDLTDTVGAFGLYGLLILYLPFMFILVVSSILVLVYRTEYSQYSIIGILLLLGHSVLAGHFIFSAMAMQFAGALMSIVIFELITLRQSRRHENIPQAVSV